MNPNKEEIFETNIKENELVSNLIKKLEELPINAEVTIADLIEYNPEVSFIEPLNQGKIFNQLRDTCKKKNIIIERIIDDERCGGLAFYYKFKKVNNTENIDASKTEDVEKIRNSNLNNMSLIEYNNIFKTNNDGTFLNLIIPAQEPTIEYETELNLIGKKSSDFTLDEIIRMKKYSEKLFSKINNIKVGTIELTDDEIFSGVFEKAVAYANTNWKDCKAGFSEVIDLGQSIFFGKNEQKNGEILKDNIIGIIVSKSNFEIKVCYGGTDEHFNLKNGTPLSIGDILNKTRNLINNDSNMPDEKLNALIKNIDNKINELKKEDSGMKFIQLLKSMNKFDTVFVCGTVIGQKESIKLYVNEYEIIQEKDNELPIEQDIDKSKYELIKQIIINKMPNQKEYDELYKAYNETKEMETGIINIFSIKVNGIRMDIPCALNTSWGQDLLKKITEIINK